MNVLRSAVSRGLAVALAHIMMVFAVMYGQDSTRSLRDSVRSAGVADSLRPGLTSLPDSGASVRQDTGMAPGMDPTAVVRTEAVKPLRMAPTVKPSADSSFVRFRTVPNKAFARGERLVFDLGYSFITAGEAVFAIPAIDTVSGRPTYRIEFTVNSTPTFSWIYKVEDRYQTFVDVAGLFPWKFTQRIREGGYARDFQAEFDQRKGIATTPEGSYPIPRYVHDVVSAFYYARTLDFASMRPGQRTELKNFYNDSTYNLSVKFLGYQKVSVDAGTFDCFLVEPMMTEGGLFRAEGRILIWLSNDDRRIPVKVSTKVPVGSIEAELREYSGLTGSLPSKLD